MKAQRCSWPCWRYELQYLFTFNYDPNWEYKLHLNSYWLYFEPCGLIKHLLISVAGGTRKFRMVIRSTLCMKFVWPTDSDDTEWSLNGTTSTSACKLKSQWCFQYMYMICFLLIVSHARETMGATGKKTTEWGGGGKHIVLSVGSWKITLRQPIKCRLITAVG